MEETGNQLRNRIIVELSEEEIQRYKQELETAYFVWQNSEDSDEEKKYLEKATYYNYILEDQHYLFEKN